MMTDSSFSYKSKTIDMLYRKSTKKNLKQIRWKRNYVTDALRKGDTV